ncbi:MAG: HAMP domain-containing histidine kinase [Phycisphaerae bacterium]|nr:MAG: sensor histidine kinase [Planctomycetota bacterium]KAB2944302.1 MAG: HAMP domain-containing histidine kinase [Phycisphaerae bacterium]MBE7455208.1 HAMP domain-containing histidine kinase [Planctomycetia bacterium]MCK6466306.1 HAMP domain-containing histidine kinase [Phycisphaerae bacterium]MCL4720062.1 HAMP domain-containing histidine kinase [Phycisphaerae bacterium]
MASAYQLKLPLDRKITVLFGGAVLLTILATLALPWVLMSTLTDQAQVVRAEQVAMLASQVLPPAGSEINWEQARQRLQDLWPVLRNELPANLSIGPPRLYSIEEILGRRETGGFLQEAVAFLSAHPDRSYWRLQDDGRSLRFARAVRAAAVDLDAGRVLGILDVALPVAVEERTWGIVVTLLGGGLGAVLAIVVFYLVTQRLVLRPVNRLRDLTERVTAGDLAARAELKTGDEFQNLAEAFNEMLEHLARTQEDLRRINRSLDVKLGELAESNVALYESNRLKSDFLANVSHELRTPLVSIIGFADLLNDAWSSPDIDRTRLARYTRNILTSGRMLLDLINDLLDLAKIEAGKMELHLSEFDLGAVCSDLVDLIRPLAAKKELDVALHVGDDLPRMHSDSGKIKQILYNLLSNAVKFTPAHGRIGLDASRDGDGFVLLRVDDTGPGIPQEKLHLIFEKFRQLDSSRTREYEGTGLGLAITRELVNILEGQITLDTAPDRGTTFTVRLPVRISTPVSPADVAGQLTRAPSG